MSDEQQSQVGQNEGPDCEDAEREALEDEKLDEFKDHGFWGEILGRQSFRSQRDHWINFRRTSCRQPAGDQRNQHEQDRDDGK